MKKLMYLVNFEFNQIIKKVLVLCAAMVILQNLSFMILGFKEIYEYLRFEHLLGISRYSIIFYVFFIGLMVLQIYTFYKDYFGSKGIYSLMTLPSKRSHVFISKYLSVLLSFFILAVTQLLNIFITYGLYLMYYATSPKVRNGLYMAFLRDKFLRYFVLQDPVAALLGITFIVSAATFSMFILIVLKSKKYIVMAFTALALFIGLISLGKSINVLGEIQSLIGFFIWLCLIALINGFMIKKSISFIDKNEIL